MTQTFFDHQDAARIRSRRALLGFLCAILLTVVVVGLLTAGVMFLQSQFHRSDEWMAPKSLYSIEDYKTIVLTTTGLCLVTIGLTSVLRYTALRSGPEKVMHRLKAWRVPSNAVEHEHRVLIHVVEEMSIASGIPVPSIYIVNDPGYNAFAVGLSPDRAAIGVTQGILTAYSRDELQAVVAHEFSHILTGDMRLNTRLVSLLAGLFVLSECGRFVIHASIAGGSRNGDSKEPGGPNLFTLAIGCIVWASGSVGYFFGRCLQAAVSRQREFLADASAVQFTRNPKAVTAALRKLGPQSIRAQIKPVGTLEISHMMFGNLGEKTQIYEFDTHPPLSERIRKIDPDWDGTYLKPKSHPSSTPPPVNAPAPPPPLILAANPADARVADSALADSAAWFQHLPEDLVEACHDPIGAKAVVYSLLLGDTEDVIDLQGQTLQEREDPLVVERINALSGHMLRFPENERLSLLDICVPALRQMDPFARDAFLYAIEGLVEADGTVSLYEYAIGKIIQSALEPEHLARTRLKQRISMTRVLPQANVFLSLLSRAGTDDPSSIHAAHEAATASLALHYPKLSMELLPATSCGINSMDDAFSALDQLTPGSKRHLMDAGLAAIHSNGFLEPGEFHVFRAASAALHVPVVPTFSLKAQPQSIL